MFLEARSRKTSPLLTYPHCFKDTQQSSTTHMKAKQIKNGDFRFQKLASNPQTIFFKKIKSRLRKNN